MSHLNIFNITHFKFNMRYIQTHKHGLEIISTIKKLRSKFVESPRACRAFVDVCADFLMNNCFEWVFYTSYPLKLRFYRKYFPCNAEKYALLRHCEQIFDIKLDHVSSLHLNSLLFFPIFRSFSLLKMALENLIVAFVQFALLTIKKEVIFNVNASLFAVL